MYLCLRQVVDLIIFDMSVFRYCTSTTKKGSRTNADQLEDDRQSFEYAVIEAVQCYKYECVVAVDILRGDLSGEKTVFCPHIPMKYEGILSHVMRDNRKIITFNNVTPAFRQEYILSYENGKGKLNFRGRELGIGQCRGQSILLGGGHCPHMCYARVLFSELSVACA